MIVCLDTNVLVQARAKRHPYGCLLDALTAGSLRWAVSNSILAEYREMVTALAGAGAWADLRELIGLIEQFGTLVEAHRQFQFRVINGDPDDNKFTDCAITVGADYIITEDHHFAPLAKAGYKPQPIAPLDFIERYRGVVV